MQALSQSNTLKLFCFGDTTTMAFHIVINNAIFIWEGDDDLHLGRINHHWINLSSHMNCIFFFSLWIIFNSNVARKSMWMISLPINFPKFSMQEKLVTKTTSRTCLSGIFFFFRSPIKRTQGLIWALKFRQELWKSKLWV